jgi:hypothetical protein
MRTVGRVGGGSPANAAILVNPDDAIIVIPSDAQQFVGIDATRHEAMKPFAVGRAVNCLRPLGYELTGPSL